MTRFMFTPAPASEAGFSAATLAELDGYFDTLVASGQIPGHVMLLARGEKLVHAHVTGYADWNAKSPLHPDAIFTLFSMTKPLTAAAMLLLYEEGRWQLDDLVSAYLPAFKDIASLPGSSATRAPTLREIFTHTAGFSFGKTREEMLARVDKLAWHRAGSLTELIGRYASLPLDYEPGTSWAYSVATDLQAAIVERLTGERFDQFLRRRLFEPLGMNDTTFVLSTAQAGRHAPCHMLDVATGRLRLAEEDERMESIFPMGGTSFKSTALDFALFARMLLNRGRLGETVLFKPETIDLMLANHLPDRLLEKRFLEPPYIVGDGNGHALNGLVCIDPVRAGRPVGKGTYEWGGAFGSWFWLDPEHDIICVGMGHRRCISSEKRPAVLVAQEMVYRALTRR